MSRRVRLPLQIGLASLGQSTRFAALVWLGPLLLLVAAAHPAELNALLALAWIMLLGVGGVVVLVFAVDAADKAKSDRPSDVVLDDAGLTIEGDRAMHLAWSSVDGASCRVVEAEARTAIRWLVLSWITLRRVASITARVRAPIYELVIDKRGEEDVLLAEGEGEEERASLQALCDSIRATAAPAPKDAPAALPQEILLCPACGAAQVPVDAESAACPFCQHAVTMPAELRERQRALAQVQSGDVDRGRLLERVIDQPGAKRAAFLLTLGRRSLIWLQPAAIGFLIALVSHQTNSDQRVDGMSVRRLAPSDDGVFLGDIALLLLALAVSFAIVWALLAAYLSNRHALRLLCEGFGAVPPAKPGAPSSCRQCGAPLAARPEDLLVRCAYCQTSNVLGIDPRPRAARSRTEQLDLGVALRTRARARWRLGATLAVCGVTAVAMGDALVLAWGVAPKGEANFYCFSGCGTIVSSDSLPRSIELDAAGVTLRATLLPQTTLAYQCSGDCSIHIGDKQLSSQALGANATVHVVGGRPK